MSISIETLPLQEWLFSTIREEKLDEVKEFHTGKDVNKLKSFQAAPLGLHVLYLLQPDCREITRFFRELQMQHAVWICLILSLRP